jgi:hypothetical protein
MSDIII